MVDLVQFAVQYPQIIDDKRVLAEFTLAYDHAVEHGGSLVERCRVCREHSNAIEAWVEDRTRAESRARWIAENPEAYAREQDALARIRNLRGTP